jgi:hypothetical protein
MTAPKPQTAAQHRTTTAIIAGLNGDTAPLEQVVQEAKAAAATRAKNAPATVTKLDTGKTATKAAAKATHPASAAKTAPAKAGPTAAEKPPPVGKVLPAQPSALDWGPKSDTDPQETAVGAKFTYRLTAGEKGGWFAALRTTAVGKWVKVAGKCATVDEAKLLCAWAEAGAMWLTYAKLQGVPFATVVEQHSALDA